VRALALLAAVTLTGCTTGPHTVATEVVTVEKIVPVPCKIQWPAKPVPHVANLQLTGRILTDLVLIWRAAEAELEERRAYELKLEAAMKECAKE
jgi:hypothetical protein